MKKFPFYKQLDKMDCGPTCLRIIAKYYGRHFSLQMLRELCEVSKEGSSLLGLSRGAEKIGLRSLAVQIKPDIITQVELPIIIHWKQEHFVVLYKVNKKLFFISDPANGLIEFSPDEFYKNWLSDGLTGIALGLSPSPAFFSQEEDDQVKIGWAFTVKYLRPYRKLIIQLLLGLLAGGLLQFLTPFFAQSLVDVGINTHNISFVYVIIFAQIVIVVSQLSIDIIRSWILLHVSTRINLSILTDFLIKLMKLPIKFFDSKMTGDIMQRMTDQQKIQSFLTGNTTTIIFSTFNFIVFSIILAYFNLTVFVVFLISSALHTGWIALFLKRRRVLNYHQFEIAAKSQSNLVQLIDGMQEIKLNNFEQHKRWEWEYLQAINFNRTLKSLALSQYQQGGATLINQSKNLLISFFSASAVIHGSLTLGSMVAIQYIAGQLSSPIEQFIVFIQGFQDAKISLERFNEIQEMRDEEEAVEELIKEFPTHKSISIANVDFSYPGNANSFVLNNITLEIPEGRTTAIVGMSGSGKTTLLKLLLRFYEPSKGSIKLGPQPLKNFSLRLWRSSCGTVMQDGFIFSDTIKKNICISDENPDKEKLQQALRIANLEEFIDGLPVGINTKIGAEGNGISQGQKQRILIARAFYKDPQYLFFDEATNALDANNEKIIMENLKEFFKSRTVVVVAHRLSTVKNADNIVLLKKGAIVEKGTHEELIALRKEYFSLVKDQLEIGS